MMRSGTLMLAMPLAFLCGCANLFTVNRTSELPRTGVAIHLDAPQRIAYSDSHGKVCAEPTPDALQSYASSFGLGLSVPSEGAASLSNALSGNAAGLGLRTQSITLMRDGLYRICELHFNDGLSKFDVGQLMRRSQDLTLATLAIEQLTGAVVARQPILTNGLNADTSANAVNTGALLDQARKDLAAKNQLEQDAATKVDAQRAQLAALQATYDSETDPQKKTEAGKARDAAKTQLAADEQALKDAQAAIKEQKETVALLESNFESAKTSARTAARGRGEFSPALGNGRTIDKDTVKVIAAATENIVATVVRKDHRIDGCISVIAEYAYARNAKDDAVKLSATLMNPTSTDAATKKDENLKATKAAADNRVQMLSKTVATLEPVYQACLSIIVAR